MYRLEGDGFVILEQPNLHLNWLFDHFFFVSIIPCYIYCVQKSNDCSIKEKKTQNGSPCLYLDTFTFIMQHKTIMHVYIFAQIFIIQLSNDTRLFVL